MKALIYTIPGFLLLPAVVLADFDDAYCGMMGYSGWGGGWGYMIAPLVWIFVIVVPLFLGIKWVMEKSNHHSSSPDGNSALEMLNQRYARGEIDKQEYEEMKRDIGTKS